MKKSVLGRFIEEFVDYDENHLHSTKELSVAFFSAVLVYGIFGVVDWFMLPINYGKVWMVRLSIIISVIVTYFVLKFSHRLMNIFKSMMVLFIIMAQAGIVFMIYLAEPEETAYYEYYAGLIITIIWAAFVFRLPLKQMVVAAITNILIYNIVAVGHQRLPMQGVDSVGFAYFVNNNFLLTAASFLAVVGSKLIDTFRTKLHMQNLTLKKEKNQLVAAKLKAEESDRLKSTFLSNMSHEIRTPMNAIIGFSDLLKKPNLTELEKMRYIDIIQMKGSHLMQLINDIIDISRIEANEMPIDFSPTNLNDVFDEVKVIGDHLLTDLKKDKMVTFKVIKSLPNEEVTFICDRFRLRQILTNLVNNALKFTEFGGVNLSYELPGNGSVLITVSDTGPGIAENRKNQIFERFRQLDSHDRIAHGGTGLGLNIVKHLVQLMNGEISLHTVLEKGSQFTVKLPFVDVNEKINETAFGNGAILDLGNFLILIAEDDDDNYYLLEELLNPFNVKLMRAKDGQEAIDMFQSNHVDLVLMDIRMPKMDGIWAFKKMREISKHVPVIAQTAYAMKEDLDRLKREGFDDIATKPIDGEELIAIIKRHIIKDF
jgi:signal transduction histidine kinase